jgi:hypothetical protein
MRKYFDLVSTFKTPDDVLNYVKQFTFDLEGSKLLRKDGNPPLPNLEELMNKKAGTCSNIAYFIVKSINFIDTKYSSFGLYYDWASKLREDSGELDSKLVSIATYKIPVWFEKDLIYVADFDGLDVSSIKKIPYISYEELHNRWFSRSERGIKKVDPNAKSKFGVSILDIRVANDKRIIEAIHFFGVDSQEYWYSRIYENMRKKDVGK